MSDPSSPESTFDTSDIIMSDAITDDVTTQLAAAGMYYMYIVNLVNKWIQHKIKIK